MEELNANVQPGMCVMSDGGAISYAWIKTGSSIMSHLDIHFASLLLFFSDGHLGHIFTDGPMRGSLDVNELRTVPESDPKLGYKVQRGILNDDDNDAQSKYSRMPRFCINGIALRFEEEK